jgi:hypothetical protein
MRKLLAVLAATLSMVGLLYAASVPPLSSATGCSEPSQLLNCLNQSIQNSNVNSPGLNGAAVTTPTTTTAVQTLGTVTIPANTFGSLGQGVRVKCWGTGTATGTNSIEVSLGTLPPFIVPGGATTAGVFDVDMTAIRAATASQTVYTIGNFNTTFTTPTISAASNVDTSPMNAVCSGLSTTSGQFILNGFVVEQIK